MRDRGADLYLRLLANTLANTIYEDVPHLTPLTTKQEYDSEQRANGKDWPVTAHTMIGLKRLDNLRSCAERVIADGVPGDFAETGVWRGGACIFLRGVLEAYGVEDRRVWAADSFQGMPPTPEDGDVLDGFLALDDYNDVLAVSLDKVKSNFARYGLLDEQVRFVPGWFHESLPQSGITKLAILRLDGDLYKSTMDALDNLYPTLSPGGFVIVDDYIIPSCRRAVTDFRAAHGIEDDIERIDDDSVYWRRAA